MMKREGVNTEIWSNPMPYSWRYTLKTFLLRAEVTERNEGNAIGNQSYKTLFEKDAFLNDIMTPKLVYSYSITVINCHIYVMLMLFFYHIKYYHLTKVSESNPIPHNEKSHYIVIIFHFTVFVSKGGVQADTVLQVTCWVLPFLHKKSIKVAILHSSLCLMECCKTRPLQCN